MARTDDVWNIQSDTYIHTTHPLGYDILINGTNKYLNFNSISGSSGYGVRDNNGTMEFKDSGGTWTSFQSGVGSGTVTSVTGTTNRITISGTPTVAPIVDIASTYVGQTSITTLGTITTGVWNGTAIANANLANSTITIGTTTISLGATSLTLAGLTSVTSTTFVGALTGNASTATALQTARTIGGVSFDGTANITVASATGGFAVSGGALSIGAGSVGTPALNFSADTDNGLYYLGTNNYGFSVGGGKVLDLATTGLAVTGTLSASSTLTASTTIELGHATDTTLSRVSAGVIAVEGVTIATSSNSLTFTNKSMSEAQLTFTDITTGNASTSNHGFLKKLSNTATQYMDGTGNWSTPAGTTYTGTANQVIVTGTVLSTPQDIATTSSVQFGKVGINQAVATIARWSLTGTQTGGAPSLTAGAFWQIPSATYTNNVTGAGANAGDFAFLTISQPTIDGNGGTYSINGATLYIANSPTDTTASARYEIMNHYSLWIKAGTTRIDDKLVIGGSTQDAVASTRTWSYNISFNDDADKTIGVERTTTAATAGRYLTINAGGAVSGGTNKLGGLLTLSGGISTGTGTSSIYFKTATAGSSGTADNTPSTKLQIDGNTITATSPVKFNGDGNAFGSTNWGGDTYCYVRSGATNNHVLYILYDSTYKDALSEKEWFTSNNNMFFGTSTAHSIIFYTNGAQKGYITSAGSFVFGGSALATNATDGFLYIPTCAGTPTGTPTAQSGTKAMIYDTTNNKIWIYNGSWRGVAVT